MKTKEFIKLLQEADPSGELECSVGGDDIWYVEKLPAYYDGYPTVLIRDEAKKPFYDIVGAKYLESGTKLAIKSLGVDDVIWTDPDAPVETDNARNAERVAVWRSEARECITKLENDFIVRVLFRYQSGWVACQAIDHETQHINSQWWSDGSDNFTQLQFSLNSAQQHLNQGESIALVKSGLFVPRIEERKIVWRLDVPHA